MHPERLTPVGAYAQARVSLERETEPEPLLLSSALPGWIALGVATRCRIDSKIAVLDQRDLQGLLYFRVRRRLRVQETFLRIATGRSTILSVDPTRWISTFLCAFRIVGTCRCPINHLIKRMNAQELSSTSVLPGWIVPGVGTRLPQRRSLCMWSDLFTS